MSFAFQPGPQPAAALHGSNALFPVRRIYCIGRNYADHVKEMGGSAERDPPIYFAKFADTLLPSGSLVPYPPQTGNFHFEAELVMAIGVGGRDIAESKALEHVFGYAAGLDMTRRDLQADAKKAGAPWDMAKNFSACAPLGAIHRVSQVGHLQRGSLTLTRNGVIRQQSDLSEMIWSCAEIIANLSRFDALAPGDLIFTGTPAGVGPVARGDVLEVVIEGLSPLHVTVG